MSRNPTVVGKTFGSLTATARGARAESTNYRYIASCQLGHSHNYHYTALRLARRHPEKLVCPTCRQLAAPKEKVRRLWQREIAQDCDPPWDDFEVWYATFWQEPHKRWIVRHSPGIPHSPSNTVWSWYNQKFFCRRRLAVDMLMRRGITEAEAERRLIQLTKARRNQLVAIALGRCGRCRKPLKIDRAGKTACVGCVGRERESRKRRTRNGH